MKPPEGPRRTYMPSGPRQLDASRRGGGGGGYRKRKAWLEILPDAPSPPPPARTHGNPFGCSNVPADRAIPLAFDHPLKEELAEVKRVRECRRKYWVQVAAELPDDMNNPGSYDYQRWKNEESMAEAKIEKLAGMIALAERGITVERDESPPVIHPVGDSARRGSDEGALRNDRASSHPAVRSACGSHPRGDHRGTLSTRVRERAISQQCASATKNHMLREPITRWKRRKSDSNGQRTARSERSKPRLQKPQLPPADSVIWTDSKKSDAVTQWMRDMGAAGCEDQTVPDTALNIGSTDADVRSRCDHEMNQSDGGVANNSHMRGRLIPIRSGMQCVWSPEDELHFQEAEGEREAERIELASALNAESQRRVTTGKLGSVDSEQVKEFLPAPVIKTERSQMSEVETAENKSKDILAALLTKLDSQALLPSPGLELLKESPSALELVQSPLPNPPPVFDRDQAVAGAVWKALQARKAQKVIEAVASAESQNKDPSGWMHIDQAAPTEVMNLQDVPDVGSNDEEIVKQENAGQAQRVDCPAPAPLAGRVLYAGNLSFEADQEQLRDAFCDFQVESVIIPRDPTQERPLGHAFLVMTSAAEAESAVAESFQLHIDNRLITIRLGSLPKKYLSTYEVPSRVAETTRGHNAAILLQNGGSQHKSLPSTGAGSGRRPRNGRSSSTEPFDKETVREVDEMLDNPTISCKSLTKVQLQQHMHYVTVQLKHIAKYRAKRDEGHELHYKEIKLINRKKDFAAYMNDLQAFKGRG
ncbi:hypothetical protein MMC26_003042 [Xylographa opegraphella]|nr:hypothetical protein [Xylographa opegraphella]